MRELIRHILREHRVRIEEIKKSTTDDFIRKAKKIHGEKYDYSKTNYHGSTKELIITCPIHGDFTQVAANHYRHGCPKCGDNSLNTVKFIQKSKLKHGDFYDYNETQYINNYTPVTIICPVHGNFSQLPTTHMRGAGCKKCGNDKTRKKLTSSEETFIEKSRKKHGNKYDYSESNFVDVSTKVKIICPKHGEFFQAPYKHYQGSGCPTCGDESTGTKNKMTEHEFIRRANEFHNNKYDYSKTVYTGAHHKITIICPIHGEFEQSPSNHLAGRGCRECGNLTIGTKNTTPASDFFDAVKTIHNNKYDYSKSNFTLMRNYITITCPIHGDFEQTSAAHLRGQGCPICSESQGEKLINDILSNNHVVFTRQQKFDDCTNLMKGTACRKLSFDFYIPNKNVCIEYDGRQHFEPLIGLGGQKAFESQKIRDKIKNDYCRKKGIKLIRIPYTMSPEEIETYLLMELGIAE